VDDALGGAIATMFVWIRHKINKVYMTNHTTHLIKEFIIPDIMTYDHPHRERSERMVLQKRIFEVKTMRVDSRVNKYNPHNSNRRAVEKRVAEIEAHCTKRDKKLDATLAAGNNSNRFLSTYKSYGMKALV